MRPWISLAFLAVSLLLLSTCNEPSGWNEDCAVATCVCRDLDFCDFSCREPGCRVDCARASSCGGQCVDHCAFTCHDTSSCTLGCGDDCAVDCSRASACEVDCRHGCRVTCSDVSSCRVTLTDGWVTCERAGACDVTCASPGGAPVPAHDCGGGRFACGPC